MLRLLTTGLLFALLGTALGGQVEFRGELARRGHLGVQLAADAEGRPQIRGLVSDGTAEKCGARIEDVFLSIGDEAVGDTASLGAALAKYRAGDRAKVKVERAGETVVLGFRFEPRPPESADDFDLLYDVVAHGDAKLRSIATRPRAPGKHPAVFFIQGLPAASTEFFPGASNPIQELLYGLTRRGIVTFRCEKSGVGDSSGEPASEVGFEQETEGFRRALAKLKSYDFVDPDRVFIFGHSMGGVMAPLVAPAKEVAGIVVFGTGVRPWAEYMVTNSRRQLIMSGMKHGQVDELMRMHEKIHHLTLVEKWSLEKVRNERPELKGTLSQMYADGAHYGTRCLQFFQELQDCNLPAAWERVEAPVLAIHGEYDWVSSEADHRYIADIVSSAARGRGRFVSLAKTFHGFDRHESLEASQRAPFRGPFNPELLEQVAVFCGLSPQTEGKTFEEVSFDAADGLKVTADLYRAHADPKTPFIVLFHQAGWSRGEYREIAPKLNAMGFNCLAVDQRSGRAINGVANATAVLAGALSRRSRYIDARPDLVAALHYARKNNAQGKLLGWGSSYSAALILQVAGTEKGLMDGVLAFAPGEYFARFGESETYVTEAARQIAMPSFITSARREKPQWEAIHAAIPGNQKTAFLPTTAGNHGSRALWEKFEDSSAYWTAVTSFLDRHFPRTKAAGN
jgi:dienelactone hydrolase